MTAEELQEWEDLAQHPGFVRLTQWAEQEYGVFLLDQIKSVLDDHNGDVALSKMRQMQTARAAALRVIGRPAQIVQEMKAAAQKANQPASMSRGGL